MPTSILRSKKERLAVASPILDPTVERVCRLASAMFGGAQAVCWTRYGSIDIRGAWPRLDKAVRAAMTAAIPARVLETEVTLVAQAAAPSGRYLPPGWKSALAVPLRAGDDLVGCLGVLTNADRAWASGDELRLADLAALLGDRVDDLVAEDLRQAGWLRERQRDLTLMFDAARMGTFDWHIPSNSLVVSGRFGEYIGAAASFYAGTLQDFIALVHSDDRASVDRSLEHAIATGSAFRSAYRLHDPVTGELRWFDTRAQVTLDPRGVPDRVIGVNFDVTEEKLRLPAEDAGGTPFARFNFLDQINDAILLTEAEPVVLPGPRVIAVNAAFTRMTGFAPEEIVGQTPRILQGARTERHELDRIRSALDAWQPVRARLTNYRRDGSPFTVEIDVVPIADASGWYTHWASVQREIRT